MNLEFKDYLSGSLSLLRLEMVGRLGYGNGCLSELCDRLRDGRWQRWGRINDQRRGPRELSVQEKRKLRDTERSER